MHELALTRDALDLVLSEAKKAHASKVYSVTMSIGYLRDIVEDIFEGLFAHLARQTIAEGAELILIRVPAMVKCRKCQTIYHIEVFDSTTWTCPECNQRDYQLLSGMEFRIDDIGITTDTASDDCLAKAV